MKKMFAVIIISDVNICALILPSSALPLAREYGINAIAMKLRFKLFYR